ncbi:iron-sulfur cluster repair protein YtfE [Oceanisphaera arctica]|uniref:Iron-sulfur cluster repair di-iron protein n=1 Tax=Oceanisphaera arctica TaxID=641510 RepID=A0A2P5TNX2_9GAMM|nr:iron-sulfur cluster repair protein YtfE [Oceanisphaera arctica]PPL17259.1 iron-sulfur cluster repair di-iron protein [Oceanisphaera arctica]GHA20186.1 putative iron-sulfur cluster repair protein [Oceanisphaera arctica]
MSLLNHSLGSLARDIPGATRVLHHYRLDYCCDGSDLLSEALAKRGLDAAEVLTRLESLPARNEDETNWSRATTDQLIDHIIDRYHEVHRTQLATLSDLSRRVELTHTDHAECPHGLADHLETLRQELESHMQKEEQILFPMLRKGMFTPAQAPISVMRMEHDDHSQALARLMELTDYLALPAGACASWQALYAGIGELYTDLMQHIHLENNILFQTSTRQEVQHG